MKPVSVIISIRNCEDYIAECLESLEAQTFKDFEVVIVLDAPDDRTPEIVESFQGRLDLRTFRNEKVMGKPLNLNRAWSEARGEFIALVDGDDVILPRKLEVQLAYMRRRPQLGFTGTMGCYCGAKEGKIGIPRKAVECRFWLLCCMSPFLHSSVMFRREIFDDAGLQYRDEKVYTGMEDYRLWAEALFAGIKFANINRDFYRWRQHADNTAATRDNTYYHSLKKAHHRYLLDGFGINASDAELALHRRFGAMQVEDDPGAVTATLEWIGKLAPRDFNNFGIPRKTFVKLLRLRWAVVVFNNCVRRRSPNVKLYFGKAGRFDPLGAWRIPMWITARHSRFFIK